MVLFQLGLRHEQTERGVTYFPCAFAGAFDEGKSLGKLLSKTKELI